MLSDFAEENNLFDYKKHNFSKSKKSHFSKGLTHAFDQKTPFFFLYLQLIKRRLEIMLRDFAEKLKRNLFSR